MGMGSQTFNFYTSTQVSSSTAGVTAVSNPDGLDPGGAGDAPQPVTVVGGALSGGGGGGGESLDDLEGPDMGDVCEVGDCAQGFWDRVSGSPIVSAVAGIGTGMSGGTCPAWEATIDAGVFGTYDLDFSFICGLWDDIAPVISAVMLAAWAFVGMRILMSALTCCT